MAYHAQLSALEPAVTFLPSMYLSTSLTAAMIQEAHATGVVGVKSYPRGVTTNSEGGVGMEGYGVFDSVFAEMEKCNMVLNLHGEVPSDLDGDVSLRVFFLKRRGREADAVFQGTCVLNAEPRFLPHLLEIHAKFPKLRIVLEHVTTAAAVECVCPRRPGALSTR